jgi:hypothetical protein
VSNFSDLIAKLDDARQRQLHLQSKVEQQIVADYESITKDLAWQIRNYSGVRQDAAMHVASQVLARIEQLDTRVAVRIATILPAVRSSSLVELRANPYALPQIQPALIETHLSAALDRIQYWNSRIQPEILTALRGGVISGQSFEDIADRLRAPDRAKAHALTNVRYALGTAYNAVRLDAYANSSVQTAKMWWSSIDSCCTDCAKLHGTVVPLSEHFPWEQLNTKAVPHGLTLLHPPIHPNCRCRILPATSDLLQAQDIEQIARDRVHRLRELARLN